MGISERMRTDGQSLVDCLNSVPLYTKVVSLCGYSATTVQAMNGEEVVCEYTAVHNSTGRIVDLIEGNQGDVVGRASEQFLLYLFDNMETMKQNPAFFVMRHGYKFGLPKGELTKILGHVGRQAARYFTQ